MCGARASGGDRAHRIFVLLRPSSFCGLLLIRALAQALGMGKPQEDFWSPKGG